MVRMSWLARRRLTAGLCGLGHSPEWWRVDAVRFAHCQRCDECWVGRRRSRRAWLAAMLRNIGSCRGQAR
jgi:hypothetical protein